MPQRPLIPFVYVLHCGNLYGTERMALETLLGLRRQFQPILFAPPGPAVDEAKSRGCVVYPFANVKEYAQALGRCLDQYPALIFVATSVTQSTVCVLLNLLYRRDINHFHIVHGGSDDRGSYGRKKWLNHAPLRFITVSQFARQKMIAHGVRPDRISVIPNFLSETRLAQAPRRRPYDAAGLHQVLIVSRMDAHKRVGLLLDALDRHGAELAGISFKILGLGPEMKPLADRAAASHPNVTFAGYSRNVAQELTQADLLLHTCPVEPFPVSILEAFAANLVTLVPDQGGTAEMVENGISGFTFRADDPDDLAARLIELNNTSPETLNRLVQGARRAVDETFSPATGLGRYAALFSENRNPKLE